VPSAECRVPSAECRVPSAECRVPSAECRVPSAECRVPSAECCSPGASAENILPLKISPLFTVTAYHLKAKESTIFLKKSFMTFLAKMSGPRLLRSLGLGVLPLRLASDKTPRLLAKGSKGAHDGMRFPSPASRLRADPPIKSEGMLDRRVQFQ